MTPDKVRDVLHYYETLLSTLCDMSYEGPEQIEPQRRVVLNSDRPIMRRHLLWMTAEADKFVAEGRTGKAFRWLGFIQGALWAMGAFSIESLRIHNMKMEDKIHE